MDEDLQRRLTALTKAVERVVAERSANDPNPGDSFRGLYVSAEQVDTLLGDGPSSLHTETDWYDEPEIADSVLGRLGKRGGLTTLDANLLVVLLAPEVDTRFERFYAYLHDDITRRRASPGLALELCGLAPHDPQARARFQADAPLMHKGLITLDSENRPLMSRSVWLPEPVVQHLLGGPSSADPLSRILIDPAVSSQIAPLDDVAGLLEAGVVHLTRRHGSGTAERAIATLRAADYEALTIDASRADAESLDELVVSLTRRVTLERCGIIVLSPESLPEHVLRRLCALTCPLVLIGVEPPGSRWSERPLFVVEVDDPTAQDRQAWWMAHLRSDDVDDFPVSLRLDPDEIARTVDTAVPMAQIGGQDMGREWLATVANRSSRSGLHRLARHVVPGATWDDLVVGDSVRELLGRIAARINHRELVMGEWELGRSGGRGEGTTVLFAGPSGTGKTLAAEVIANDLGFDMYVVDLSTVVDKYIGETEKNLERIFAEAEATNAVLFFDEADALFGKRSDVSDAKDRYANIEVAYLLQRMETFNGLSILATNLRANLDDAFTRRLSLIVEFKQPEAEARLSLWKLLLGSAPLGKDVDLEALAEEHELAGGSIRSSIETAAFLAADAGHEIDQATLLRAVQHEYEKAGRLWRG